MASMQSYLPAANPHHAAINLIVLGTICVSNTVTTSPGRRMRQFTQCSDLFSRWNVTPNFFPPQIVSWCIPRTLRLMKHLMIGANFSSNNPGNTSLRMPPCCEQTDLPGPA
ncbi:hypothetical protein NW760_014876 [Fusarium oxysporum]|nr:hypothetical protein NW760_014876 [Fusarium oxysporum]